MKNIFTEKQFFIDIFSGITLVVVVNSLDDLSMESIEHFNQLARELVKKGGRVWIFIPMSIGHDHHPPFLGGQDWQTIDCLLTEMECIAYIWQHQAPLMVVRVMSQDPVCYLNQMVLTVALLRPSRVILIAGEGGLRHPRGGTISFMNHRRLQNFIQQLADDGHKSLGVDYCMLTAIEKMIHSGVEAVSLCRLQEIEKELLTFDGSGTFFSRSHYCSIRRLGLDDFSGMEKILYRGVKEGYLLPRNEQQILQLLMSGFGAFVVGNRLAGIGGLLTQPYGEDNAGEIVSLYTLTRFQGEGIAGRLINYSKREARHLGLDYLFACTTRASVVDYFIKHGFMVVSHDEVPQNKWLDYDPSRMERVVSLRWGVRRSG